MDLHGKLGVKKGKPVNRDNIKKIFLPVAAGAIFILLWQMRFFHYVLGIEIYQLPLPSSIAKTIADNWHVLLIYSGVTLSEAICGILIGSFIGFIVAVIATVFPKWGYGGLFVLSALNAVPIIALAPIMNMWFGDGLSGKISVVVVTTMAAMAFNVYRGINDLKPFSLDLMKAYGASKWSTFWKLRLPNCIPNIMTALKINMTAGMIGAIISEFFYSSKGLGYMISNSVKIAKMSEGWAGICFAALIGILMYSIITTFEKYALKWHSSQQID